MASSQNKKNNSYIKESSNNYKIELFIKDIDNRDLENLKISINNIKKINAKKIDIPLELYENGFLTSDRLNFIIKNCKDILYISSSLQKILIKNNEIQLLQIIFDNFKFYDNEFIKTLLHQYKNKSSTSITNLNEIISKDQYKISTDHSKEDFQDYFVKACEYEFENIIKYFIEHGADVNKVNKYNITPLFFACKSGNENLVKYLIEHGADIKIVDIHGYSPLFMACQSGNENLVKYLVEIGAYVNKANGNKETPLYCACEKGNIKIAKYLIEHGADIKIVDIRGYSPLFMACESGNENLVKYLVEVGADINKESYSGKTPLFMACESGNANLVKYLVELGIDITIEDTRDETALFIACRDGNEKIVKYLVEHGADINKKNQWAETPLFFACINGNEKIIEYLVEEGAYIYKVIDVINSSKNILYKYKYILQRYRGSGRLSTKEDIKKYLIELYSSKIIKSFKI